MVSVNPEISNTAPLEYPSNVGNYFGRSFVYLAYLDDSDTRKKIEPWQVVSGVLIPGDSFLLAELVSAMTVEELLSDEKRAKFEEFHACELYGGHGVFEGIEQGERFKAIATLLAGLSTCEAKVAYGAVRLDLLTNGAYGSALPHDVAFRRCAIGIGEWLNKLIFHEIANGRIGTEFTTLFIMDESAQGDKITQNTIQKSFRSLRGRFRFTNSTGTRLPFVHDDMYFGDSKYSVGIQIADLCSYFIARHLAGDSEIDHFYKMIEPHIVSAATAEQS